MTVSSTTNRAGFNCDGTTVLFPFTFKIIDETDLLVYLYNKTTKEPKLLTLNIDYGVTIASPGPGGDVELILGVDEDPPGTDFTLTILRSMPRTQEIDFVNFDRLEEENIEGMGDRLTMMVQELDEKIGRSLMLPTISSIKDLSLPPPNAGKFLRWNALENGLENASLLPGEQAVNDFWGDVLAASGSTLEEALVSMGLDPGLADMTPSTFGLSLVSVENAGAAKTLLEIDATPQVDAATEEKAGIAELATQAETNAGTDDNRIITPKKLYATPGIYRKNLLINGGFNVAQRNELTLSSFFAYGMCDRWIMAFNAAGATGKGNRTTGNANLSTGSALHAKELSCNDANSIVIGQRVESHCGNHVRYALTAGKKLSLQVKIYHDFGAAANAQVTIHTANAADNFAAVTERYASGQISCNSGEWTNIQLNGISPTNTDFEKGFLVYIKIATPAGMSNKGAYFGDAQLEIGDKCTEVEAIHYAHELALCQRYWEKSYDITTPVGSITLTGAPAQGGHGSVIMSGASFKARKRVAPNITLYSPYDGAAERVSYYNTSDAYGGYISPCYGSSIGETGFNLSYASGFGASYMFRFHWVASAEL